jgi:hypothetical protein
MSQRASYDAVVNYGDGSSDDVNPPTHSAWATPLMAFKLLQKAKQVLACLLYLSCCHSVVFAAGAGAATLCNCRRAHPCMSGSIGMHGDARPCLYGHQTKLRAGA